MKYLLSTTALVLALALTTPVNAVTVTVTDVSGIWVDIDPNLMGGVTGLNTKEIRWGNPNPAGGSKSGYRFDGVTPPDLTFNVGDGATLGTFTHFNFPIDSGTSITAATLNLSVTFTSDLFSGSRTFNSQFIFQHNETPNECNPLPGCANDIVTASVNPSNSDTFHDSVTGHDFLFGVTGFQRLGVDFHTFSSPEGQTNTALLRGSFADVTTFNSVPGPIVGAGLPGLVTALTGLVVLARRRRRLAAA